jgi:membrane fusion protein
LIRVTASQPGVLVERNARDGLQVQRGQVLFVLSSDRAGPDAQDFQQGIARQIEARRLSLEAELSRLTSNETQETGQLRQRLQSLQSELTQITGQATLLKQRVQGAENAVQRYKQLFNQGYASKDELLARESDLSEARTRVQVLSRDGLALERDRGTTQRDLDNLRARYADQRATLQRAVLLTQQEFTELEARRRVVVAAPAQGELTLVQAELGQSVDTQRALAHLIPQGSPLVAKLYVPSRSAGFARPGTEVLLRYDAYPYQKFGQHSGKVLTISSAAVAAAELQGLSLPPELASESLFAITVALPAQQLGQDAAPLPLSTGMKVEADLMHERRPLYEWMLEPLFAMRARVGGS